eukprot:5110098-Prymnesium_polylepis.1
MGRHHSAHSTPHPQAPAHASSGRAAWPEQRASAAGDPGSLRTHTARTAHTAHPHSPPAARMMHMSRGKVVCGPRGTRGGAAAPPALRRGGG